MTCTRVLEYSIIATISTIGIPSCTYYSTTRHDNTYEYHVGITYDTPGTGKPEVCVSSLVALRWIPIVHNRNLTLGRVNPIERI